MCLVSRSTFFFLGQEFLNWDFSIETWLRQDIYQESRSSRLIKTFEIYWDFWDLLRLLRFIETFEIYWDFWDLSRLFKISQHYRDIIKTFSRLQAQKSWQIEKSPLRNVIKLTNSQSRSRQTVKICQKCHFLTDFSISIETFGTGKWCQDKIKISQSQSRLLDCRDKLFESVEIFSTIETYFFLVSRLKVSIETTSRQIETPRLTK